MRLNINDNQIQNIKLFEENQKTERNKTEETATDKIINDQIECVQASALQILATQNIASIKMEGNKGIQVTTGEKPDVKNTRYEIVSDSIDKKIDIVTPYVISEANNFILGNSVEEIFASLEKKGVKSIKVIYEGTKIKICYTLNNKENMITIDNSACTETDEKTGLTFSRLVDGTSYYYSYEFLKSQLDDFSIDTYFTKTVGNYYSIKCEYASKCDTLEDIVNNLKQIKPYQDQTILTNFLNNRNYDSDSYNALLHVIQANYDFINVNNFEHISSVMTLVDGEELEELKQNALDKLQEEFIQGLLTVEQAKFILNALDIFDFTIIDNNNLYTISFKYNDTNYEISCQKEAAEKSTDDITQDVYTEEYIQELKSKGVSNTTINEFFIKTSDVDGCVKYALILGKNIKELFIKMGELKSYTDAEINALNIGISQEEFDSIKNFYFEEVAGVYVLHGAILDDVKNVITEIYIVELFSGIEDCNVDDEYNGYALTDKEAFEDRKANYYYMCYMSGTIFSENDFNSENLDVELANMSGLYPYENIFENYLKNPDVRKYLKDNFGIEVPSPDDSQKFESFIENNQALWDKLAVLSATDTSGNYTGEYYKPSVLKCFGLALTNDKFNNYINTLSVKTPNAIEQKIDICKNEYPAFAGIMEDIFAMYGNDSIFAIKVLQTICNNIDDINNLGDDELKNFALSDSIKCIVDMAKAGCIYGNTHSESVSQQSIDNFFKESRIIDTAKTISDLSGNMFSTNQNLIDILKDPTRASEFTDKFMTLLAQSGQENMSMEEFTSIFALAAGIQMTAENATSLMSTAYQYVNIYVNNVANLYGGDDVSSFVMSFIEDTKGITSSIAGYTIRVNNILNLNYKAVAVDACTQLAVTLQQSASNFWGNVFGEIPSIFSNLINNNFQITDVVSSVSKICTNTLVTALKSSSSKFLSAVGGALGFVAPFVLSLLLASFGKDENGKLTFSLKKGLNTLINEAKSAFTSLIKTIDKIFGTKILSFLQNSKYTNFLVNETKEEENSTETQTNTNAPDDIYTYVKNNYPDIYKMFIIEPTGRFDQESFDKTLKAFTDNYGNIDYELLNKAIKVAGNGADVLLNGLVNSIGNYDIINYFVNAIYQNQQEKKINAVVKFCYQEANKLFTGLDLPGLDTIVGSLEFYMLVYADSDTFFEWNAKEIHKMLLQALREKYSHAGELVPHLTTKPSLASTYLPYSNNSEGDNSDTSLEFQCERYIQAPQWFKDGLKNGTIHFDSEGNLVMSDTEENKLDEEAQRFNSWYSMNESLLTNVDNFLEIYEYYQFDIAQFTIWLIIKIAREELSEELSFEEQYELYKKETGGIEEIIQ